jgi:biopolymer transport protein ExbD
MAYRPSMMKKHKTDPGQAKLQLTSMMDMFTIILVFLLKIYSTHGQLIVPSQDLTLPMSVVQNPPELGLDVTVSSEYILVNGREIERTENIIESDLFIIPELQDELLKYATQAENMEDKYGIPFSGKATIQGDKRLPYHLLMRVMATCGQSRYPNMRLVVYTEESS